MMSRIDVMMVKTDITARAIVNPNRTANDSYYFVKTSFFWNFEDRKDVRHPYNNN